MNADSYVLINRGFKVSSVKEHKCVLAIKNGHGFLVDSATCEQDSEIVVWPNLFLPAIPRIYGTASRLNLARKRGEKIFPDHQGYFRGKTQQWKTRHAWLWPCQSFFHGISHSVFYIANVIIIERGN